MTVSNQAQVAYSYDSANRRTSLTVPILPPLLAVLVLPKQVVQF
jgi:hypothetical protein